MTKEQIEKISEAEAKRMVDICVSQAGIMLTTVERKLVLLQAQHLFLGGVELGLGLQSKALKGGDPIAKSQ